MVVPVSLLWARVSCQWPPRIYVCVGAQLKVSPIQERRLAPPPAPVPFIPALSGLKGGCTCKACLCCRLGLASPGLHSLLAVPPPLVFVIAVVPFFTVPCVG